MKRRSGLVVPVLVPVLLAALTACSGANEPGPTTGFTGLDGDEFTMAQIYGDGVRRVVIACPYTEPAAVQDALGFDYSIGVELDDDSQAAIFASDGESVTDEALVARSVLDFCSGQVDSPIVVTGSRAFVVRTERDPDGGTRRVAAVKTAPPTMASG